MEVAFVSLESFTVRCGPDFTLIIHGFVSSPIVIIIYWYGGKEHLIPPSFLFFPLCLFVSDRSQTAYLISVFPYYCSQML